MNPIVKIIDEDTGNVMYEGYVMSYSLNSSMQGTKISIEAAVKTSNSFQVRNPATIPLHAHGSIAYHPAPKLSVPKNCDHSWKKYQGFMDSYDYCEKCNEKKT